MGLVFTTFQGKMLSKRYIDRAFKDALKRAGLPESIRVHDLRHGVATQWLSAGINPVVVSKRLGHSNVSFTLTGLWACVAERRVSNGHGHGRRLVFFGRRNESTGPQKTPKTPLN